MVGTIDKKIWGKQLLFRITFQVQLSMKTYLHALKKSARHATPIFWHRAHRLPVPRLLPGGSLGNPKILSTGTTSYVGPIRLHVEIGSAVP